MPALSVSKFLSDKLKSLHLNHRQAATKSKINRANLIAIIHGRRTPGYKTIRLISDGLNLSRKEEEKFLILSYEDATERRK